MRPYSVPAFANSHAAFEAAVNELSGDGAAALDHAELERRTEALGREIQRALAQDHIDLRAAREREERRESVQGADGVERTEVRPSVRRLGMVFGTVLAHRLAFVRHGAEGGLRPLDAELNLPSGLYSQGVQREVAWGVAQGSYDTVVENLRRTTATRIRSGRPRSWPWTSRPTSRTSTWSNRRRSSRPTTCSCSRSTGRAS